MELWWVITVVLAGLVGVQYYAHRKYKEQLKQQATEIDQLNQRLSDTRQDLAEVNARRKKLLSASTQALIIVERDGRISSASKVAKRMFGKYEKGSSLMTWTRSHQLYELFEHILAGEKLPPTLINDHDRILEANARWIKDRGAIVAVAIGISDVTELQKLTRARRQFVTNISHELRTPLASLRLLTETLLNGALNNQTMAIDLVEKMVVQVDTLSQLAQEVLDLAMIESGRAPMKMGTYSLKDIADTQVERLALQAQQKQLSLRVNIPDGLTVLADQNMVGRVISNLVHNAIKFTPKGSVTVTAQIPTGSPGPNGPNGFGRHPIEEGWVVVGVSDSGVGIPRDELGRIFERFYKVDRARSGSDSGTGLGLAIAKHIVEAHGGEIWAVPNSEAGITFYFTLPTEQIAVG
jgi:two-component system phosphate regulon sensor histidine kinase PhoR